MSVWFCIPSARPPAEVEPVLAAWRERGYKIALWRDADSKPMKVEWLIRGQYPGYGQSVNMLAFDILQRGDPSCEWVVTGGDDTLPDPNHTAEEIAEQCGIHFWESSHRHGGGLKFGKGITVEGKAAATFGVMQPTGDRFAGGSIDRIAGSPWLGREWCLRANGRRGPFWPEFTHMFGDEALKRTAEKLGVYWARPDLIHKHMHFQRESDAIDSDAVAKPTPPHLVPWSTPEHWNEMKAIFQRLEADDFKSCLPL